MALKDYELTVFTSPQNPTRLVIDELQVNEGRITRVPVTVNDVHLCGT